MADFLNTVKADEQLYYKEVIGVEDGVMVEMTVTLQDKDKHTLCSYKTEDTVLDKKLKIPFKIDTIAKENNVEIMKVAFAVVQVDVDEELVNEPSKSVYLKVVRPRYKLSDKGRDLLRSIEVLRLKLYDDQTGKEVFEYDKDKEGITIGYGHLLLKNKPEEFYKYKKGINKAEALELFNNDLKPFEDLVNDKIKVNITQQQFDALVILAFNIGDGHFKNSSVVKLINDPNDPRSNYKTLEEAWRAFNKSQGKISNGLINRRNAELKIYKQGVYERW